MARFEFKKLFCRELLISLALTLFLVSCSSDDEQNSSEFEIVSESTTTSSTVEGADQDPELNIEDKDADDSEDDTSDSVTNDDAGDEDDSKDKQESDPAPSTGPITVGTKTVPGLVCPLKSSFEMYDTFDLDRTSGSGKYRSMNLFVETNSQVIAPISGKVFYNPNSSAGPYVRITAPDGGRVAITNISIADASKKEVSAGEVLGVTRNGPGLPNPYAVISYTYGDNARVNIFDQIVNVCPNSNLTFEPATGIRLAEFN